LFARIKNFNRKIHVLPAFPDVAVLLPLEQGGTLMVQSLKMPLVQIARWVGIPGSWPGLPSLCPIKPEARNQGRGHAMERVSSCQRSISC